MAWEELDRHGFIKTITGKGTFVASISSAELQQKASTQIEELAKDVVKKSKEINVSLEDLFLQKIGKMKECSHKNIYFLQGIQNITSILIVNFHFSFHLIV